MPKITVQRTIDWQFLDPVGHWYHARAWYLIDAAEAAFRHQRGFGSVADCAQTPRKAASITFYAAPTLNDIVDVAVEFTEVGVASATYRFEISLGERTLADGQVTIVHVSPVTKRAAPWPDAWRQAML